MRLHQRPKRQRLTYDFITLRKHIPDALINIIEDRLQGGVIRMPLFKAQGFVTGSRILNALIAYFGFMPVCQSDFHHELSP